MKENNNKVYIVMIHDDHDRPYVYDVYSTREKAETTCNRLNIGFNDNGMHADFISTEIIK